jgi:hypothetical protein
VLGSDGKPRPDFRWDNPDDTRDVTDVLREDGVRFDANGAADPSQRITAAELPSLIEVLDDDAMEAGRPTELVGQQESGTGIATPASWDFPMTGSPSDASS